VFEFYESIADKIYISDQPCIVQACGLDAILGGSNFLTMNSLGYLTKYEIFYTKKCTNKFHWKELMVKYVL
jgi:hypothetical protein